MHSTVDLSLTDGIVLVTVRLDNPAPVAQRVRLRNRLDGLVLPPRRGGVPEPGWDDTGFDGVVPADSTVALGYACPVDGDFSLDDDSDHSAVVAVTALGRASETDASVTATPDAAIRTLGAACPPADAVPVVTRDTALPNSKVDASSEDEEGDTESEERFEQNEGVDEKHDSVDSPHESTDDDVAAAIDDTLDDCGSSPTHSLDDDFVSFLAAAERRISLAERLDGASVREAASVLEHSSVRVATLDSLAADRARLRRLAERATKLADRAADADPDVDALRSIA
ncbi:hypothetical protein GJR96_04130 [Haloferax sp. MBLA0076]|uniref:DUF8080 domain-containing protein n=1 Tax=Haloferax litoreum TaxID=2666140 RepID=A0A6A8GDG6_9EURY|nr:MULTISPECIES: hypothetical protein [Haloferax]KAB1192669.1 hypothetical protein Hfx1148_04120 [Haloferax sp. CBA1148]MRX21145.1 hypothetical protein [Haloferax litoreum]